MKKLGGFLHRLASHQTLLLAYIVGHYVHRRRNNIEIIGRENFPKGTGIVIVSNHLCLTDSWDVGTACLSFWEALCDYNRIPWNAPDQANFLTRNRLYGFIFGLLKNVPVVRGRRSRELIDEQIARFVKVLASSNLLLFFEGTRSRDGTIGQCKSGVPLTIQRAKPRHVVPVRLVQEGQRVMPIDAGFNWLKISRGVHGKIIIGKPIEFTEEELADRKLMGKRIRDEVLALHV